MKPLNSKQLRFCQEYLVDFNRTEAAIRAGYETNQAQPQSSRLLTKTEIQEKITELSTDFSKTYSQERLLSDLSLIATMERVFVSVRLNALETLGKCYKLF